MLHLVHVTTTAQTFGFLREQMRWMRDRGVNVAAITSPDDGPGTTESEPWRTHRIAMRRGFSPAHDLVALVRLTRLLRALRPLIVHCHTPKAGLLGSLAARIAGVPTRIYHVHGLRYQTSRGWRRRLLMLCERVAGRCSSRVLCVSESVRSAALSDGLFSERRLQVVGEGSIDGVDAAERFNPDRPAASAIAELRRDLGVPEDAFVIGFVGRLVVDKGIVELADAWRRLRDAVKDARLMIVGDYEEHDPVPQAVRDTLAGDPRVHFAGRVSDVEKYYALMHVMCLPTYREGLPYAPIEAAAMRVPTIASRVCGCVDAVVDGETGLLVRPRDPSAIIEAVLSYRRDETRRRRHGENARRRVLERYDPETLRRETHEIYRELTGEPLPASAAEARHHAVLSDRAA